MKNLAKLFTALLFIPFAINAQDATPAINTGTYNWAIGLRGGNTSGLTIKKNFNAYSLEGIIGLWSHGFNATLLYERNNATTVNGLNWYYGGGGHLSAYTGHVYGHGNPHYHYYDRYDYLYDDGVGLGVDGVIGIEYKFPPVPFAVSFDLKPFVEVTSNGNVWGALDPGLGIKFTF